ncbi:helix-turn-helix domain-containing protein [Planctomycetota bacterium]|nr:helix-turn-helix domain-containing protein [Planctomycetota bacterium]
MNDHYTCRPKPALSQGSIAPTEFRPVDLSTQEQEHDPSAGKTTWHSRLESAPTSPLFCQLLLNRGEAAELLRLSERKLGELTRIKAIPSRQIDRSVRYVPAELSTWISIGCPTAPNAWEDLGGAA